jgi:hypothetical protein
MIESLRAGLDAFFTFIPQLIGAILILIIGYIVAKILQAVVSRVLKAIGFDGWMERGGIKQFWPWQSWGLRCSSQRRRS